MVSEFSQGTYSDYKIISLVIEINTEFKNLMLENLF